MASLATIELEYVVRGYHEYLRIWTPVVGEVLTTVVETENEHDSYAVAVVAHELETVGRVPSKALPLLYSQRWYY
jgi:hypothetical protein